MANIHKSMVTERILTGLGLKPLEEDIPSDTKNIIPVFVSNEVGKLKFINSGVTTGNTLIFTVPKGFRWKLLYGTVYFNSSATVGNRTLRLQIKPTSSSTSYWEILHKANITAGQAVNGTLNKNATDQSEYYTLRPVYPIPQECILDESGIIKWWDVANIDVAGDQIAAYLAVIEYSNTEVI
jgi:hypothetical protein